MGEENKTLGKPPEEVRRSGFGCPADGGDGNVVEVLRMLRAGSPRLALARAMCIPFQPTLTTIVATFPSTSTTDIPDVGADQNQKFEQDTLIEKMVCQLQNEGTSANSNIFQPQSDYFYNFQSGILAKMQVVGAPKYSVAGVFTPLSTLCEMVSSNEKWPDGWILGLTQQIIMDFHADIPLPDAPYKVYVTFRGWIPKTDIFNAANMTNREAVEMLRECGYTVPEAYRDYVCSMPRG